VLVVALVLVGALVPVAASAGQSGRGLSIPKSSHVASAKTLIKAAIAKEDDVVAFIEEGHSVSTIEKKDITKADGDLLRAQSELLAASTAGEISESQEHTEYADLARAASKDYGAKRVLLEGKKHLALEYLHDADVLKHAALGALPTTLAAANTLSSPIGNGTLAVADVKCYIGTGNNPERDAQLTLKSPSGNATWYVQEVSGAAYIPGGSTAPEFFIENGPAPYTASGITIYGGFAVTVSGDVGTIASGQSVTINGPLVNSKDGSSVPGSDLKLVYKCP